MSHGAKSSIGASAVRLVASSTPCPRGVQIKAAAANGGKVHVGLANTVTVNSADATDGFELSAGEGIFLAAADVADATDVWLIASTTGQKVFWWVVGEA